MLRSHNLGLELVATCCSCDQSWSVETEIDPNGLTVLYGGSQLEVIRKAAVKATEKLEALGFQVNKDYGDLYCEYCWAAYGAEQ